MLINAQKPEEVRVAILDEGRLEDLQIEIAERGLTRGNIYRGSVVSIQPSLNAAFIDYGAERNGFISFHDVLRETFHHQPDNHHKMRIQDVLDRGKPLVVQVTKEGEGQKGAALTTNLSIAGRYLVLTPLDDTRGVSRKVEDEDERAKLKEMAGKLKVPPGAGFIIRTNALGQPQAALKKDFTALVRVWKRIQADAGKGSGPQLLYSDQNIVLRGLRDLLDPSIQEVLVDSDAAYEQADEYMRTFLARGKTRLVRYTDRVPLFSKFNLDEQIDRIYDRKVTLPSGGSVVIDRTEALVAIDVNSGKSMRAATQEETAVNTNLEAAKEVSRQLRLRDIGGLIVVDFIDMRQPKNRQRVEKTLSDALKNDKARTMVGRISQNGLLEINRQRIGQALLLRMQRPCPTCEGTGRMATPEMIGLNLLRKIEAHATSRPTDGVRIELHPEIADAFQNGRRREIAEIERELGLRIEIIASYRLHRPDQQIEWTDRAPEPQHDEESHRIEPRERKPHEARPAEQQARPAEQQPHAEAPNGNGEKKKRRRRRGGKKHREEIAALPVTTEEPQHFEAAEPEEPFHPEQVEFPAESAPPQLEASEAQGERKRRRRRRGRRGQGHAEQPQEALSIPDPVTWEWVAADSPHVAEVAEAEADGEPVAELAPEHSQQPAQGERKRRRRRGGRKHRARHAGEPPFESAAPETEAAPSVPETPPAEISANEATPSDKPKRRRPGRKKPAVKSAAAEGTEGEAPRKPRRRRPKRAPGSEQAPQPEPAAE